MAVTRFTLPAWRLRMLETMMERAGEYRAAKELARAATRPGLTAELTQHEFMVLYELANWPTPMAVVLDKARADLQMAMDDEAARPRGIELLKLWRR